MIIPMLCVTIFVILVGWFLLPRVARLMSHTPTAMSIFVAVSVVQTFALPDRKERLFGPRQEPPQTRESGRAAAGGHPRPRPARGRGRPERRGAAGAEGG